MIVSAIGCLNIPIGTLAGVYSLWVLLQDETIKLFDPRGRTTVGYHGLRITFES